MGTGLQPAGFSLLPTCPYGAPGETRTLTLSHEFLRLACLPISSPGHFDWPLFLSVATLG